MPSHKGDKRASRRKLRNERKSPVVEMTARPTSGQVFDLPPIEPEMFINRELSWLNFNERVLAEASETGNPLLERVKFASIFSSNLDEFFMIRVAGVKRKIMAGITLLGPDGRPPTAQLDLIRAITQRALDDQARIITRDLIPALYKAGIRIVPFDELTKAQKSELNRCFIDEIYPILTPQGIDRGRRFPHVSNRSLNLIVALALAEGVRYARVKIPATLSRFVQVLPAADDSPESQTFTLLEQVIAANLAQLFTGATVLAAYPFHVTRDSDIELDEDDEDDHNDLMETMREHIAQRAFGPVVRLMTDTTMPDEIRQWLVEQLHATDQDLYVVDSLLAPEDLMELGGIDRPDLKYQPFSPAPVTCLSVGPDRSPDDVFASVRDRDVLVHHPYQTFGGVVDFLKAAASDPDVVAIKQTLYRLGKNSPLIPTLIEARDDDTQVAVLVELKARFDEENNITWAEELERHGVHVAYGLTGLKTHCKATLIVRREPDGLRRYVHVATGNYNASTARLYEDLGYLTAREDIGADISDLFNVLTGFSTQDEYRKIWTAPGSLRRNMVDKIEAEIDRHYMQGNGYLAFKVNALVDRTVIRALYKASRAGVKVDLIVRGACCLRPGVPDWSENIRVLSLVGRFLEHSRIYQFGQGEGTEIYLGSADLMERNLDRRVEVVFPVEDPAWATEIRDEVLGAYLRDTVNTWELDADGSYRRRLPGPGEPPFDAQAWFVEQYQKSPTLRAERSADRSDEAVLAVQ
jgi:polyphosphate kinase